MKKIEDDFLRHELWDVIFDRSKPTWVGDARKQIMVYLNHIILENLKLGLNSKLKRYEK